MNNSGLLLIKYSLYQIKYRLNIKKNTRLLYLADQNKHKKTSSEKKIYFPNHVQSPKSSQIAFEETCGCQIRLWLNSRYHKENYCVSCPCVNMECNQKISLSLREYGSRDWVLAYIIAIKPNTLLCTHGMRKSKMLAKRVLIYETLRT